MISQKQRHLQGCSPSLLLLLLLLLQIAVVVRCDYPPPSEDGQKYYSRRHQGRAVVGGGSSSGLVGDGFLSEWNSRDWTMLGIPNPGKCVSIPANMSLCHGIGYDQMRIPNLLEHETLKEATSQAQTWVRLLGLRCHADTQVFLCSLFAPVCLERPIWPCRSLCEAVQAGCEDRMLKYGFPWPEMLRCDKYPSEEDLCIGLRNENNKEEDPSCSACQADTFESTVDNYCQSDFAMRIKVRQAIVTGPDMKIDTEKKKKVFKAGSLSSSDLRDSSLYIVNGSSCDCGALDNAKNGSSFIVMGNMASGRPVLSFIHRIEKKSKDVNRAMRVARKPDVCTKTDVIGGAKKAPSTEKKTTGAGGKAKAKTSQPGKSNRKTASPPSESKQVTVKSRLLTTTTPAPTTKRANRDKKGRKKNSPATPPLFY